MVALAAPLLSLLLLLLVPTSAAASTSSGLPPASASPASGTYAVSITSSVSTTAGNDIIRYNLYSAVYTGTFSGTTVGGGSVVVHPDGTIDVRTIVTFTGTILGSAPGTATGHVTCAGTEGSLTCVEVTDHGEGGLAGVHAEIVATRTGGATAFTYTGLVWFTPQHYDSDDGWSTSSATQGQATPTTSTDSSQAAHAGWSSVTVSGYTTTTLVDLATTTSGSNSIAYLIFNETQYGGLPGTGVGFIVSIRHSDGSVFNAYQDVLTTSLLGSAPGTYTETGVFARSATTNATGHFVGNHATGGLAGTFARGTLLVDRFTHIAYYTEQIWFRR